MQFNVLGPGFKVRGDPYINKLTNTLVKTQLCTRNPSNQLSNVEHMKLHHTADQITYTVVLLFALRVTRRGRHEIVFPTVSTSWFLVSSPGVSVMKWWVGSMVMRGCV